MTHRIGAARVEQVRILYCDTDVPVKEIAQRTGVHAKTIYSMAKSQDWPRRGSPVHARAALKKARNGEATSSDPSDADADRPANANVTTGAKAVASQRRSSAARRKRPPIKNIVDRLYHIINHNLELMETRMSDDDQPASDSNPERDMRAISSVVRSVDKLKEIEPEQSKRTNASTAGSRYPLSPEEEDRLRKDIIARILKLRERR